MCSKLYCNVSSTMLNFYLVIVLRFSNEVSSTSNTPIQIALIPLIQYISSMVSSYFLSAFFNKFSKTAIITFATLLSFMTSLSLYIINVSN